MTITREGDGGKEAVRVSLRQKKCTVFALMLGVPALLYLIAMALERTGLDVYEAIPAMAFFAVIAGVLLHVLWMRCPHCGSWLERNDGEYCQNCGKRIDWDAKPGKE